MDYDDVDVMAVGSAAEGRAREALNLPMPVAPLWELHLQSVLESERGYEYGRVGELFAPNTVPGVQAMALMDDALTRSAELPHARIEDTESVRAVLATMLPQPDPEKPDEKPDFPGIRAAVEFTPKELNAIKDKEQRANMAKMCEDAAVACAMFENIGTAEGAEYWGYLVLRFKALANILRQDPKEDEQNEGEGDGKEKGGGGEGGNEPDDEQGDGGSGSDADNPEEEFHGEFGQRGDDGGSDHNPTGQDAGSSGRTGDGGGMFMGNKRMKV